MLGSRLRSGRCTVASTVCLIAVVAAGVAWPAPCDAGRRKAREREPSIARSTLPVDSVAASRLRAELGSRFHVKHSDHYRIAYDTDAHFVDFHARLFEAVHSSFRSFFESSGFRLRKLDQRLEAVMFDDREAFQRHARKIHPKLEAAGGFYSTRENRIVLFDSFTDANYRSVSDRITASERNVAQVRRQLVGGKRDQSVTLSYSDGRRETLSRKQALAHVRAEQRVLRQRRRELESHFADRNLTTTIHECVHQLSYNLGVQSPLADNPKWLGEGLANYFETMGYRDTGPSGQRNPERFKAWQAAAAAGTLIPMDRLVTSDDVFDVAKSTAATAYGQAWALVHYLFEEHPEEFFGYLRRVADSRAATGRRDASRIDLFRQAFGDDLAAFERRWHRYMSRL
jgi:hypothetical protein